MRSWKGNFVNPAYMHNEREDLIINYYWKRNPACNKVSSTNLYIKYYFILWNAYIINNYLKKGFPYTKLFGLRTGLGHTVQRQTRFLDALVSTCTGATSSNQIGYQNNGHESS